MPSAPKLNPGQLSLVRCDINTGHVLTTTGELFLQIGEIYQIFDSPEEAEKFVSFTLPITPDIEFMIYDHMGQALCVWNRFERRLLT